MITVSKYVFMYITLVILFSNFVVLSDPHPNLSVLGTTSNSSTESARIVSDATQPNEETANNSVVSGCEHCSPCEVCVDHRCLGYLLGSFFTEECGLLDQCVSRPCQSSGRCVTSLGVFVCDCPHDRYNATCGAETPARLGGTVTDVHVAYPPMVAAGTPVAVLVAFSDSVSTTTGLTLHYRVPGLNIYWASDRRQARHHRPRSHCVDSALFDPFYCATLPDETSYSVIVIRTEFPFVDNDNAENVEPVSDRVSPSEVIYGYKLRFTIALVLSADWLTEPLQMFHSDYLQMVYYREPRVYRDSCFPRSITVSGSTNCQLTAGEELDSFKMMRSSPFSIRATSVEDSNPHNCYTDVSYTLSRFGVNINPTKYVLLKRTTNSWFTVAPFSLPLTDQKSELLRIEIIVKNKLLNSDSYVSNFAYCWITLIRRPLFAQIGGGDLRTAYAYKDLVMTADQSTDPNFPPNRQQGLFFEWSCNETDSFCNPVTTKAREYIIRPPLRVNVTYVFKLKVYAIHSPAAYDEQEVTVTDVEYASFLVECLKNCGDSRNLVNPDKTVYLRVNVSGVETPTDYFEWTYAIDPEVDSRVVPKGMRQANTPEYICIVKAGNLKEGKAYRFAAARSNPRALADILIRVGNRSGHVVENCTVSPRSGVQLLTPFTISCKQFDVSDRLFYNVYSDDSALNGLPVYFDILQAPAMIRPLYYEDVQLRAMNLYGCYSVAKLQVNLTTKEEIIHSVFQKHCKSSNPVLVKRHAAECLTSTLYICLTMSKKNEQCANKLSGFWDLVIRSIHGQRYSRSPYKYVSVLSSLTKLVQINGLPKFSKSKDNQIIMLCDIFIDFARIFKHSYNSARKSMAKDIMFTFKEVHQIAKSIYICYVTVLDASLSDRRLAETMSNSMQSDAVLVYWKIFSQMFTILEGAIVQRLLPVENPFHLKYKNNSLYFRKEMPDYFSHLTVLPPESNTSSIRISRKLGDHFKNITTFVMLEIEVVDQNVYWWDPDTEISTQIVFAKIKPVNPNGEFVVDDERTIVKEPLDLRLYVKEQEWRVVTGVTVLPTTADAVERDESVAVYCVTPPAEGRGRLSVQFSGLPLNRPLRVVMTANFWPDFDYVVANAKIITNNSNKIDLSYDMYDPDTSLYIGVLPSSGLQPGVQQNFTFKSSIGQCFIRVVDTHWVANSCLVGNDTDDSMVHCRCHEVDVTAASALAPAIRRVETQRFTYYSDVVMNHLLLKSVCAFLIVFGLFCLWGWLLDRVLLRQSGVVVLDDNYPGEEWAYLVGVYSGARDHAGSSSNVAIRLVGARGRSRPHVLRRALRTYSDEWFLLFTPETLGRITQLRLWVDCEGASPSWYCRKVVVYDWAAGERYVFRLSRWFYLEPDGYQLQVEVAPRAPRPLEVLVDNLVCGVQLMYLPVSIFWHHPRDYLTRVEAIALAFFKMSFTSLVLLFYYKFDNLGVEDYPSYRLLPKDIVIGLLFYLFTVPLYLIQSVVFKKQFDTSHMTMWTMVDDKLTYNKAMYSGRDKSKTETKEKEENVVMTDETPTIDYKDFKHRRVFQKKHMPVILNNRLADKVKRSNKTLFVAWTILLVVIGACCLLMVSEGRGMGPVKSQVWLSVSVLSIVLGLVLCEPTRVFVYTFLSSVVSREAWDEPVICCDPRMAMQLEAVGDSTYLDRLLVLRARPEYLTMAKERFHELWERQEKKQMWKSSSDTLWALVIYCVLLVITLGKWSAVNYQETPHLMYAVNHPASQISPGLGDIKNLSVMVSYINNSLVPVFYKTTWYNGKPLVSSNNRFVIRTMVDDFVSKRFGSIMLRQKRTTIRNCVPQMMRHLFPEVMCSPKLSDVDEDRENYTIGWQGYTPMDYKLKVTPWTFRHGLRMTPIMYGWSGEYYKEGGYELSLGSSNAEAANILWKMEQSRWFDHLTRVIFVKICVFNVNTNKFSIISLCMEIRRTIGVDTKIKVVTVPFSSEMKIRLIKDLLTITITIIMIVWLAKDIVSIQQLGMEFFHSFWNVFGLIIAALLLSNFLQKIIYNVDAKANIMTFMKTDRQLGFPRYQWSTLGGETYYELCYFLLVAASAVLLLKHCGDCINLSAVLMTLRAAAGPVARVCLLAIPIMYIQFHVVDSLLFNYKMTTARLPLVNGNGLRTYSNNYTFSEYSFVPYLYCQSCVLVIIIMGVLITHHYKLAKHSAERLKSTLAVASYVRRRVGRRLRRNRERRRRLRGGADGGHGPSTMSRHTLDAVCLMVIQESTRSDDECMLKNIKNFVNAKLKHDRNENNRSTYSLDNVYRNIDCKLDKIIYSLTKFSEECEF